MDTTRSLASERDELKRHQKTSLRKFNQTSESEGKHPSCCLADRDVINGTEHDHNNTLKKVLHTSNVKKNYKFKREPHQTQKEQSKGRSWCEFVFRMNEGFVSILYWEENEFFLWFSSN